jgi:2,7-dihydroxy-5-methyl-1-naphthoate 7-O-methyltransferase
MSDPIRDAERFFSLVDLSVPMAIRVAATLNIADHIAQGNTSIDALAAATRADESALSALLHHLSTRGVFSVAGDGSVGLGELGAFLSKDHPVGAAAWMNLEGIGGRMDRVLFELLGTVRSGKATYATVYGKPFWEDLDAHPALAESFDALMASQIGMLAPHVAASYDWSSIQRVIDVGGGTGTLLAALAEALPHLKGEVIDMPATVTGAKRRFEQRGLADRCGARSGSFFDALPADADVYLLSGIIHDWNDEAALQILKRCSEASAQGGRVLIVEPVLDGDATGTAASMDLRMRVLVDGRERTLKEYEHLAARAGLTVVATHKLPLWNRAIIDCRHRPL